MRVWVPGWDVCFVKLEGETEKLIVHVHPLPQVNQKFVHGMSPCLRSHLLKHGLHGLFSRLLRREMSSFIEAAFEVGFLMVHRISTPLNHVDKYHTRY